MLLSLSQLILASTFHVVLAVLLVDHLFLLGHSSHLENLAQIIHSNKYTIHVHTHTIYMLMKLHIVHCIALIFCQEWI